MTIRQKTISALKNRWLSTTQLIMTTGASSSDRERRRLEAEGYNVMRRNVKKHGKTVQEYMLITNEMTQEEMEEELEEQKLRDIAIAESSEELEQLNLLEIH